MARRTCCTSLLILLAANSRVLCDAHADPHYEPNENRLITPPELFRLGSGAVGPLHPAAAFPLTIKEKSEVMGPNTSPDVRPLLRPPFGSKYLHWIVMFAIAGTLALMHPGHGGNNGPPGMITGGRDFNYRIHRHGAQKRRTNTLSEHT